MGLLRNERTTRLGRIGEVLAAERLEQSGFSDVADLNATQTNYPFADISAVREGKRFLISVKTRNEMRQGNAMRHESYNVVQVRDRPRAELQRQGKTTGEITQMLLEDTLHADASALLVGNYRAMVGQHRQDQKW